MAHQVPEAMKHKIIALLQALFPGAKIYLYGSRARQTNHDRSDIDLAIDTGKAENRHAVGEAKEILAATDIPYKIDLVDLNFVQENFRDVILREGVIWNQEYYNPCVVRNVSSP